jgi:ornithine cyclodeaminase/alanine dehydrogenase-like protein (mu-crystallin family)
MTVVIKDELTRQLLPMSECVQALEEAIIDFDLGVAHNWPARIRLESPSADPDIDYRTNIHIGMSPRHNTSAVRVGQFRIVDGGGMTTDQFMNRSWGLVYLYSLETAELLAIINEFTLSGIRVAATDGVAAKYLAREDATTVGQFGSGKIARSDLEAMCVARPIRKVKVFSPNAEHRAEYAREMSETLGIEVIPVDEPRKVVEGVDIVCCSSGARAPVFDGNWLEPGQLVTCIVNRGGPPRHRPTRAELARGWAEPPRSNELVVEADETAMGRAAAIVILSEALVINEEHASILGPIERGVFTWDQVYELGAVARGAVQPRKSPDDIICFFNNGGLGIQMAAAGAIIYRNALEQEVGERLPTEWFGADLSWWTDRGYHPSG